MASSHNNTPKATSEKNENNAQVKRLQRYLEPVAQSKNIKYTETTRLTYCTQELKVGLLTRSTDAIFLWGATGMGNSSAINVVTDEIMNSYDENEMKDKAFIRFSFKDFMMVPSPEILSEAIEKSLEKLIKKGVKMVFLIAENIEAWNFDQIRAFMRGFRAYSKEKKRVFEMLKLVVSYSAKEKELQVEKDKFTIFDFSKELSENVGFKVILNQWFAKEPKMSEVLKPRITELEESYKIHLDTNVSEYVWGVYAPSSYSKYLKFVEELLVYAAARNETLVTLEILKSACFEVNYLNGLISTEKKELVAYHEAGHMLMILVFPEFFEPKAISCFSKVSAGVTWHNFINYGVKEKEYFMARVIVALGGKVVEEEIRDVETTGARMDLKMVKAIVSDYLSCSGDKEFGAHNYSIYQAGRVSEKTWYQQEVSEKEVIRKLTKRAKKILKKHEKFVHILAKKLVVKEMLTSEEVMVLWTNYKKKRKESKKN